MCLVVLSVFIVFLSLKLSGVIVWSWVWVVSPLWLSLVIMVVLNICARSIAESRHGKHIRNRVVKMPRKRKKKRN